MVHHTKKHRKRFTRKRNNTRKKRSTRKKRVTRKKNIKRAGSLKVSKNHSTDPAKVSLSEAYEYVEPKLYPFPIKEETFKSMFQKNSDSLPLIKRYGGWRRKFDTLNIFRNEKGEYYMYIHKGAHAAGVNSFAVEEQVPLETAIKILASPSI